MASRPRRQQQKDVPLPATPLDSRLRALQEQELKNRERMERCQKLLEDAPKLAAERAREQREELIKRAARTVKHNGSGAALPDRRYLEANVAAPAQQRRMRAERRQGRLMFFFLLLALAAAVCFLYYTVTQG
jgi:hypothetical protein